MNEVINFNHTDFELYLIIMSNENVPKSPEEINMFVKVSGVQMKVDSENDKTFENDYPLKLCERVNNS